MQYNRARYYDTATGRWISEDPERFGAGDTNLERYVGNGPTNATDPGGLQSIATGFMQPNGNNPLLNPLGPLGALPPLFAQAGPVFAQAGAGGGGAPAAPAAAGSASYLWNRINTPTPDEWGTVSISPGKAGSGKFNTIGTSATHLWGDGQTNWSHSPVSAGGIGDMELLLVDFAPGTYRFTLRVTWTLEVLVEEGVSAYANAVFTDAADKVLPLPWGIYVGTNDPQRHVVRSLKTDPFPITVTVTAAGQMVRVIRVDEILKINPVEPHSSSKGGYERYGRRAERSVADADVKIEILGYDYMAPAANNFQHWADY